MKLLTDGPVDGPPLLLAHGAGAPMDSDFLESIARGLGEQGVRVVRFEFPYMRRRRAEGRRFPPDRQPVLLEAFREALASFPGPEGVVIGGKSMGGRMASLLATEVPVAGVVCFGYPAHPRGRPERTRLAHLPGLRAPMLICQGERDPMGGRETLDAHDPGPAVQVRWFADGDHDLRPRKRSGHDYSAHMKTAVDVTADFIHRLRNGRSVSGI